MNKPLRDRVDKEISLTFSCVECGDPLKAREDKDGEISVEFCTSCRDYADTKGYDRGYAEGLEKGQGDN